MNSKKKLYGSAALLSLLLLVGCSADEDTATNDSSAVGSSEMIESSSEQDESMMEDSAEGDMEESELLETPYIYPRFPKNYNVVGGTTPKVLYNCDCFFVISPTRTALPGFSNASMTSNSSSNSCIV